MISKRVFIKPGNDNYARLAVYIADAGHTGEKCLLSWAEGMLGGEDYAEGIAEAIDVQARNTRAASKTYHLVISFRPDDEAKLTPEAFKTIEQRFAAALGYTHHQRHCGVHKNTGNLHMHVAYNMINPEKGTLHKEFRDFRIRDKLCREIEREYGLTVDNGLEQRRENALSQNAATIEAQTGQESFESYAKRHKDKILEALEGADHWQDLHEVLRAYGMGIKPHGNGLVVTDLHGKHTAKASTIDRSLSFKRLQERLGDFQPYRSLRQIRELSRYKAVPLHRSPERGELYARFKEGIDTRKNRLEAIKDREDKQIAAIRQEWAIKRREIEGMSIQKRNRRNLLALARKHENEALAKAKLTTLAERDAVRQDIPYTSWQDFLKLKSENGNEVALAVLRSRNESVGPETVSELKTAPAKDWSRHGQGHTGKTILRAEYAEKERELLERFDLSVSSKKELQAFLRMEQITAEARAQGTDLGEIKRHIDGKGIVIFTLESGGTIRDIGKDIYYSIHDSKAGHTARLYAKKKWGKRLVVDKGHIMFHAERKHDLKQGELERPKRQQEL